MTTRPLSRLGALLVLVLLPHVTVTVAHAQTRTVRDGSDAGTPAAGDIRWVRLDNSPDDLAVTVRLRHLRPRSEVDVHVVFRDGRGAPHYVDVSGQRDPSQQVHVQYNLGEAPTRVHCPGLRVDWSVATSRLHVRVPGSCGGAAYDRFAVHTEIGGEQVDTVRSAGRLLLS
jgi:hypothetical protein